MEISRPVFFLGVVGLLGLAAVLFWPEPSAPGPDQPGAGRQPEAPTQPPPPTVDPGFDAPVEPGVTTRAPTLPVAGAPSSVEPEPEVAPEGEAPPQPFELATQTMAALDAARTVADLLPTSPTEKVGRARRKVINQARVRLEVQLRPIAAHLLRHPEAGMEYLTLLDASDPEIAARIGSPLLYSRSPEVVAALRARLLEGATTGQRMFALRLLRGREESSAGFAILGAAQDPAVTIRAAAVRALGGFLSDRQHMTMHASILSQLRLALDDPELFVQTAALGALIGTRPQEDMRERVEELAAQSEHAEAAVLAGRVLDSWE